MKTETSANSDQWYRQPMVWMIIAIPLSSVIVGGIMLTLAITSFDGLVVDDYYEKGKAINMVLRRDEMAKSLNLSATVRFGSDNQVIVQLNSDDSLPNPGVLQLKFLHRTRSGLDQITQVRLSSDGMYHGVIDTLGQSQWLVQLETGEWRITGEMSAPGINLINLVAI
jgi:hypothetical protein